MSDLEAPDRGVSFLAGLKPGRRRLLPVPRRAINQIVPQLDGISQFRILLCLSLLSHIVELNLTRFVMTMPNVFRRVILGGSGSAAATQAQKKS
jgi:hypothetical protein